jgi:hypothetical protein
MCTRNVILFAVAVAFNVAPARAQESESLIETLRSAEARLWAVRVGIQSADTLIGRVRLYDFERIAVGDTEVQIAQIRTIERKAGASASAGAMIAGAAIGGLSLFLVGSYLEGVGDAICASSCRAGYFIAGAVAGGIAATIVSSGDRRWVRIWPSQ